MAQTKPKAAQFYGVSGDGTAGQVLISDGNGGMSWGANTEEFTVSWNTPTGQSLTYTQPNPQSSSGSTGNAFPSTTFTATKSGEEISGTATIAGLPTGITATQSLSGTGIDNVLTFTLSGVFPGADSLNTALTISGLTVITPFLVNYLIVAGGGGGGGNNSGGGGAGGYLASYSTDLSGDSSANLNALSLSAGVSYTVTIGAGGAGVASGTGGQNGGIGLDSVFATLTADGGGCGRASGGAAPGDVDGGSGGGGGYGGSASWPGGTGTSLQGGDGADGIGGSPYNGGGGGGASGDASGINGANGLVSTIDGGTTTRAGGGGGGQDPNSPSSGGTGGGGAGGTQSYNGGVGTVNTGSGGGGGGFTTGSSGGAGGSGIIILRYPSSFALTNPGSGLTFTTATVSTDKVTTFTAGTGNIQFN